MANGMNWEERWEMHWNLKKMHDAKAMVALRNFGATKDERYWEEYKVEDRLARKHYGIHKAMYTRYMSKLNKQATA